MYRFRFVFSAVLFLGFFACYLQAGEADNDPALKVALTGKYPPFSMYSSEGELAGFDVDISRAIAEQMGRTAEFIPTEWDGILAGLLSGQYDVIIGSMAITEERKKKVNFSDPYYESGAQLFIHERDAGLNGIQDCAGKRIGVVLGETFEHYLVQHHPEVETVTYKSTVDIFADVENGRLTGFVSDRLLGAYQIKQEGKPFIPSGPLLYREKMGIPVVKERPELLKAVNSALQELKKNGTADDVYEKWFGLGRGNDESAAGSDSEMKAGTAAAMLVKGFLITLGIAFLSILIGFLLAVPEGLVLNNPRIPGHRLLRIFNDFLRGTPVLIQLFFVYFGVGGWISSQWGLNIPASAAAVFTLALNASAYMAEVVRSGLMAVPAGQKDAARALGLTKKKTFFLVVWPQAFRIAIPPLMNSVVALIKDTALVSVITVAEVVRQAQSIISVTFDPVKYYLIVAVMFFVVTFPLMKLSSRLEAHIKAKGFK